MNQLRRMHELTSFMLRGTDGDIGGIEELYFDDESWAIRYCVVNTGSWLRDRRVLLAPMAVAGVEEANRVVRVKLTREQIETSPPIDTAKPISRAYEEEHHRHFQWVPYWQPGPTPSPLVYPTMVPRIIDTPPITTEQREQPHLRSSAEITGYSIQASDGMIGHVEDLVIDDTDWVVRYFEIDTQNWLPGKKVLVAPVWIDHISWADRSVVTKLTQDAIQSAPEYDPSKVITPEYEVDLFKHYGQDRT